MLRWLSMLALICCTVGVFAFAIQHDSNSPVQHYVDGQQVIDGRPAFEDFHILTDSTGKEWLAIDNNVIIYGEMILVCDSIPCAKEGVLDE